MGTFNTQKMLNGSPVLIPAIAAKIESSFAADGYSVNNQPLFGGGADISISKGGVFKAGLGMRTALKISLTSQSGGIAFNASVGIFGQQIIPTVIMLFFAWPVIITQIWGIIQQSKLDDKALAIAEDVIAGSKNSVGSQETCPVCGNEFPADALFCPVCGQKR